MERSICGVVHLWAIPMMCLFIFLMSFPTWSSKPYLNTHIFHMKFTSRSFFYFNDKEDLKKYSFAKTVTGGLNQHGVKVQTILFVNAVKPVVTIKPTSTYMIRLSPTCVCSKQWKLKQPSNN